MVARNDITGDAIQTKASSQSYADNYERIFGKKIRSTYQPPRMIDDDHDIDPDNPDDYTKAP